MEQREGGKDTLATGLQERLTKFASSETKEREASIAALVEFIMTNVSEDLMRELSDSDFQEKLDEATEYAAQIKLERRDKTVVEDVWLGGGTIVGLREDGKILGASSSYEGNTPDYGAVWKKYGDLNKYALVKSVAELHLYKANRFTGLSDPDNFNYLVGLGLKAGDNLFTGSTKGVAIDGSVVYIASSGCAGSKTYLKELLAGAESALDTQAGLFESVFSRFTATFLQNPNQPKIIPEPQEIQQLRINN